MARGVQHLDAFQRVGREHQAGPRIRDRNRHIDTRRGQARGIDLHIGLAHRHRTGIAHTEEQKRKRNQDLAAMKSGHLWSSGPGWADGSDLA